MRGKALRGFQVHVDAGITPAYAGKSSCNFRFSFCHPGSPPRMRGKGAHVPAAFRRSRDHPRMCREKVIISSIVAVIQGSPPHVRGKERSTACNAGAGGITPACAGKSTVRWVCQSPGWDHPRVCGGKDRQSRCTRITPGITPAYAGKSRGCPAACILRRDHPRVCGEKALLCLSLQQILGSPPRMRGKAFPSIKTILLMRITPAYAGKSC